MAVVPTKVVIYALGANIAKAQAMADAVRSYEIEVRDGARFSATADQVEERLGVDGALIACIDAGSKTAAETALLAAVDAVYTSTVAFTAPASVATLALAFAAAALAVDKGVNLAEAE